MEKLMKVKESDKKSMDTLKGLQAKSAEVQAQIEAQNKMNSNHQKLVDIANASALKVDESDDEDINPRRMVNVDSGKTKRKLADNLDVAIDVIDFDKSSDVSPRKVVPSTPLNSKKLLTPAQSSGKFQRKSALANLVDKKGVQSKSKNNIKDSKAKLIKGNVGKKADQEFDEIMQISSVSP